MLSATLCSDILAIRCINEHICIGVGNFLNVYEIKSRQLVARLNVFHHDNIHSIVKGPDDQLFVHGGKSLCICSLEIAEQVELKLSSVRRFDDWIIAIGWTRYEKDTLFLSILFAQNNLRFYDTDDEKIQTVRCKEKCILYGGSVLTKNNGETVVFGGTVFQEILVWRATYRDFSNDIFVLHRLKGHKGVVFSVIYDPTMNIISSTSDDRTTRVWKVTNTRDCEVNEIIWEDCEINLTTTMYGHTARVWRSIVRDEKIITVGEDSHMCVWSTEGKLLDKVRAHEGAEIWSIDVSDDNKVIFTGGADGAVNVWPFGTTKHPEESWIYNGQEGKVPKFIFYASNGNIIIFMDGGHLMILNRRSKKMDTSANLPRYSSYCVMEISLDRRKIALGSKEGHVDIYNEIEEEEGDWKLRNIVAKKVMETKILSLHWLSNETIMICGVGGLLKLVDNIMETDSVERSLILPASRERWTTAAIVHKNYLICGDRAGSVYIFNLTHDYHQLEPVQVFSKIHGRLGVQSLAKSANRIISTGRDGTLRFYELKDESETFRSLHLKKMPMDWVCKILRTNDDLYVLGFKEVELIIYSMNLRRIVRRLVCGGGHRSWDCTIVDEKINFLYIRDKIINEIKCSLGIIDKPIINGYHTKEIYRVKPVGVSSNRNIIVSAGEDGTLRVACIVESESIIQKYRIDTLAIYEGHASNVRSLEILNLESGDDAMKNLVISGGGRAQLKIWEMSVVNVEKSEKRLGSDDVTCKELSSYMLRGTDEDRKKKWQSVKPAFFVDPETRFMDISAIFHRENSNLVVIFVACSDGYIRTLLYDIVDNIFHPSDTVNYCNRCVLGIKTIQYENEIISMAMTTDGIVSFWRMSRSIENLMDRLSEKLPRHIEKFNRPFSKLTIHQSGINSFDLRKIDDSRWLLLTGGDDNLLSLVVIEISSEKNVCSIDVRKSWNSSSIHCAQITGTKFVDDNLMMSTGIDQRVVVHSYAYVDDRLSVARIEDTMTLIPDVQGLALNRTIVNETETETLACVYGKGIEVIVLKNHTRPR